MSCHEIRSCGPKACKLIKITGSGGGESVLSGEASIFNNTSEQHGIVDENDDKIRYLDLRFPDLSSYYIFFIGPDLVNVYTVPSTSIPAGFKVRQNGIYLINIIVSGSVITQLEDDLKEVLLNTEILVNNSIIYSRQKKINNFNDNEQINHRTFDSSIEFSLLVDLKANDFIRSRLRCLIDQDIENVDFISPMTIRDIDTKEYILDTNVFSISYQGPPAYFMD